MSAVWLPQEILDTITDKLAEVSFGCLKALALTSQRFPDRCRSHLFRKIVISTPNEDYRHPRFTILLSNTALLGHVRQLRITFHQRESTPGGPFDVSNGYGRTLLAIAAELRGLKRLYVDFTSQSSDTQSLGTVGPRCRAILDSFLNHPLVFLALQGLRDIPISTVSSVKSLTQLIAFNNTHFTNTHPQSSIQSKLESLTCHRRALHSIHSFLPFFRTISHLAFEILDKKGHVAVWSALREAKPNLKTLILDYSSRFAALNLVSDCSADLVEHNRALPPFPQLRYLAVYINTSLDMHNLVQPHTIPLHAPSLLPSFLYTTLAGNPQISLEILDFSATWIIPPEAEELDEYFEHRLVDRERGWKDLDEILSNRQRFPKLQTVCAACFADIIAPHYGGLAAPDESMIRQIHEETAAALCQTREAVSILDVGLDESITKGVDEVILSILPDIYPRKICVG